jgi:hypothetical protein
MDDTEMPMYLDGLGLLLIFLTGVLVFLALACICGRKPEEDVQREALEQRAARALAAQRAAALQSRHRRRRPCRWRWSYRTSRSRGVAANRASETAECAVCLEPLRLGQLCSEVPACRPAFHRECLGMWAKSNGSCPLCRAKIGVLGSDNVAIAGDIV